MRCPGYERQSIFVNSGTKATSDNKPTAYVRERYCAPATDVSKSLNDGAFEHKYAGFFWSVYLPSGRAVSRSASQLSTAGWTSVAQSLFQSSEMVRLAIGALGFRTAGYLTGEECTANHGAYLYGEALRHLSLALQSPDSGDGNSLIATCRLLTLSEASFQRLSPVILAHPDVAQMFFGGSDDDSTAHFKAWAGHNSGEASIISLREPEAYSSGAAHTLLADGRFHIVSMPIPTARAVAKASPALSCIMRRKRCFLNSDRWKTIPWKTRRKSPKDKLTDIVLEIPGLLEDLNELMTSPPGEDFRPLAKRILSIESNLERWHMQFSSSPPAKHQDGDDVKISRAHLMSTYWTIHLLLSDMLHLDVFSQDVQSCAQDMTETRASIIGLLPRLINSQSGWFGKHVAVFPAGVALRSARTASSSSRVSNEEDTIAALWDSVESKPASAFMNTMQARRERATDDKLTLIL